MHLGVMSLKVTDTFLSVNCVRQLDKVSGAESVTLI